MTIHSRRVSGNNAFIARLMLGTALSAITFATAQAQGNSVETVVVTGTSIRGAAPVGSNLITVDRAAIEATGAQTTQELLTYVPQVSIGFGSSGQTPDNGVGNASGPTLHSLGSQSASATLILIDGHRIPPSGSFTNVTDPSIIPAAVLQRVEVLPDGASSIYGADALAGVINFITRKDFSGWETTVQSGYAPGYNEFNFGQLWGENWTGGSVVVAYDYSSKSNLMNSSRRFITARQDIYRGADATTAMFPALAASPPAGSMTATPGAGQGTTGPFGVAIPYPSTGSNLQNFNCPIATIAANNTAPAFLYPYNGTGISTTQTTPSQGVCDTVGLATALGSQTRNSILITARQQIMPNLVASLDIILSSNVGTNLNSRGAVTATVFGPTGSNPSLPGAAGQNPFYTSNATVGTASQTIRYNFDDLLGPGAYTHLDGSNMVGVLGFDWDIGGDWAANFDIDVGQSQSPTTTIGAVCSACAFMALNGTTNAAGSANTTAKTSVVPDSNGLGAIVNVTRPLTTLTALDVWNPAGATNRTSPAVLNSLVDSARYSNATINMIDLSTKVDGPILDLWAGPLKGAFGAEYNKMSFDSINTGGSAAGGASTLSAVIMMNGVVRSNTSAFAELQLPLIAPAANIPMMESIDIDVSGRFDHFSDFGDTYNPKVGINWVPFDGLKAHASYGTSFMAPQVDDIGAIPTVQSGPFGQLPNGLIIPFNTTTPYSTNPNPNSGFKGDGIAGTFVATAANCAAAGSNPVDAAGNTVAATSPAAVACKLNIFTSTGISYYGADPHLAPQKGVSYSAGLDIDAGKFTSVLDGLIISATYYNTKFVGYIAASGVAQAIPNVSAFAPPGGWPSVGPVIQSAISGRAVQTALPDTVWYVTQAQKTNAFILWQEGLDFSIHYRLNTDALGTFNFGIDGNQIIRFQQQNMTPGAVPVSIVDGDHNGRATGIEFTAVTSVGWRLNPFSAQLQVQFAHPFSNNNSNFPYNLAGPSRLAGTQHIGPLYNANLHVTYDLPSEWFTGAGMRVFANLNNVLNTPPPYGDTTSGSAALGASGAGGGNPIGRELVVGFSKEF